MNKSEHFLKCGFKYKERSKVHKMINAVEFFVEFGYVEIT